MAVVAFTVPEISKEFVRIMENELVLGKMVGNDQLDTEALKSGGITKVRRQAQYLGQDNNLNLTAYQEDAIEGTVTVTMDQTWSNKVTLGAIDRTLSFDRYSKMIIAPNARRAAERIEASIAALYPAFYTFDGTPGTLPASFAALATAGAVFSGAGNPLGGRIAVHSEFATATLAGSIASTNVQGPNKMALEKAMFGNYAGFDNYQSVFAPTHTVGPLGGAPLVNGAGQNVLYATQAVRDTWSQSLVTNGWTAAVGLRLRAGDVFQVAGVNSVNPNTKQDTGRLQTFTALANASSDAAGNLTVTMSPPMIISGAYQTVTAAPAAGAVITIRTGTANTAYRQSLLLDPMAIALVTRPLDIPKSDGLKTSTITGEYVTMSVSEWVDGNTLDLNMRFDMLWKPVVLDPRRGMRLTN
jgi:P22 coat protein - gene protein 5